MTRELRRGMLLAMPQTSSQAEPRMPLWVFLIVALWSLMLPLWLLIAFGPPVWR